MKLKGKVALVTGAARGIGRAIAERFLQEGAKVVAVDINEGQLASAVETMKGLGEVVGHVADVTSKAECERTVEACVQHFGRVDVLANNAGVADIQPFINVSEEDWDRVIDVDLKGVFLMGQAVAKRMIAQGDGGSIINMSSTNGLVGEAELSAYNAAKAGVMLLTKTMAIELARHNIRVNAVCPGFILTELARESGADEAFIANYSKKIPLGRLGRPEEVASLYAFLASDEASFITGEGVVIDGGQIAQG